MGKCFPGSLRSILRCSSKQVLLNILRYLQENTCVGVSFSYCKILRTPRRAPSWDFPDVNNTPVKLIAKNILQKKYFENCKTFSYDILLYYPTSWKRAASSSHRRCSVRKGVLRNFVNSQENTYARLFFNKIAGLILKETLVLVFSCEFCEISRDIFLTKHL